MGAEPEGRQLQLYLGSPDDATEVVGSLQLGDGSWLHFRAQDLIGGWRLRLGQVVIAGLPMLALVFVAMSALRNLGAAASPRGCRDPRRTRAIPSCWKSRGPASSAA